MSDETGINYEAVLADLMAKRDALDKAIAGLRLVLGLGDQGGAGYAAKPEPTEIEGDTFFGLSVSDAAKKFLRMMKRPQNTKVIAEALQKGGFQTLSKNFYSTVYTALQREEDIEAGFVQIGKNWALQEWHPGHRPRRPKSQNGKPEESAAAEESASEESAISDPARAE